MRSPYRADELLSNEKEYEYLLPCCDVDTFAAGGKGGQHQNKTESAVRLASQATGIIVICRGRTEPSTSIKPLS